MLKYNIQVEIWDIQVDQEYFEFNYSVIQNGSEKLKDRYTGSCSWKSPKQQEKFEQFLEGGHALNLILDLLPK